MRVVFCDDNKEELELLLEYATRYARQNSLSIETRAYSDTQSLLGDLKPGDPKIDQIAAIFLDIYMEKTDGIEAARILRERGYAGAIVLYTVSRDHFAEGFVIDASHYLLKPVDYESFGEAMRRVLRITGKSARTVTVQSGYEKIPVPISQIRHIEVYGHDTLLHLGDRTLKVGHSLSAVEDMLGGVPFLRCYRSCIVNMDYVDRIEDDAFVMKSGTRVPIARDGYKDVKSRYLAYIFGKMEGL